ncbi:MAG: MFS transporter [Erysipelotrichaceae bacterium]
MLKFTKKQWLIIVGCFFLLAINIGAFQSSTSIYLLPVLDELGFGRGEFTFYKTILLIVSAFLLPFYGSLIKKFGIKKVMLISSVSHGFAFACYGLASEIWHFYFIALLQGLFYNGVSFMSVGVLINRWFDTNKGVACAIAFCGSGAGSALLVPILTKFIINYGWRSVNIVVGIGGALLAIPLIALMIFDHIEQKANKTISSNEDSGYSANKAMKLPMFWLLGVAMFSLGFMASGTSNHTITNLVDNGYSATFAASVFSFFMLMQVLGKLLLGAIFDKFGVNVGNWLLGLSMMLFPLFAIFIGANALIPWLFALCLGFGSAGVSVPLNIMVSEFFGNRDFAVIFSRLSSLGTIGMAISSPIIGYIYDFSGSYNIAWILLFVMAVVIMVCLESSYRYAQKKYHFDS